MTVFFVLSGYLITTLLRIEFDKTETVSISRFYVRRVFRILPLFYAVLGCTALLTLVVGLGQGSLDFGATAAQFGHITNYWSIFNPRHPVMEGTGVFWSLAVEEHFYLLFPLAFVLMNRARLDRRTQGWIIGAACLAVLIWRIVLVHAIKASIDRTYLASDTRIDSILIGCGVALVCNPVLDQLASPKVLAQRAMIGVGVIFATLVFRSDSFRETFRYSLQSLAIAAVLVFVVAVPGSYAGRLLNRPLLIWFGKISYGFYLVHYVILLETFRHIGRTLGVPIALALSTIVALLLQRIVERPAQRLRNRVLQRGLPLAAAVPPAAPPPLGHLGAG